MHSKQSSALRAAFPLTLPVMAGYLVLGMGFGILLQSKGYHFGWAILMSLTIYAGSMQYVAVDLLSGGATLVATALMTLMVNARHLFYGISMLDKYRTLGRKRWMMIFELTDETYSIVCSHEPPEGVDRGRFFLAISMLDQSYWVVGCTIGAILGAVVPIDFTGVDFAMTALFLVIVTEQWLTNKNHLPALVGIAGSVVCLVLFGADNFIIPAMIVITLALSLLRRYMPAEEPANV